MDDLVEKIKKAEKVITALTQLTLSIGTLLAVIKMVLKEILKLTGAVLLFICTVAGMFLLFFN